MKQLTLFIVLVLVLNTNAQVSKVQLSSGEKMGLKLDSLAKLYDIKHISVYFHVASTRMNEIAVEEFNKTSVASHLIDEYSNFKFDGQFIVFTDDNDKDAVRYYNLEKLIHFTVTKGKNIRVYFQM